MKMENNNTVSNSYEVGYGKPPKHTQFKPGYSGNKKGRPKGSANLFTAVEKLQNERVRIVRNGKQKSISVAEAILRKAGMDALNGNAKAQKIMLDYFEKNERRKEELAQRVEALREDDRTLLAETIKEYMKGNVNDTTK